MHSDTFMLCMLGCYQNYFFVMATIKTDIAAGRGSTLCRRRLYVMVHGTCKRSVMYPNFIDFGTLTIETTAKGVIVSGCFLGLAVTSAACTRS